MIDRKLAPKINNIEHIDYNTPEQFKLSNEANLYNIGDTPSEAVRIKLSFDAGSRSSSKVIAGLTGDLLLSGTHTKTSDEIEEAIDQLGGYTNVGVSTEKAVVTIYGVREHIVAILKIVVDAILNVNFDVKEVNQELQEQKKRLEIQLEKVSTKAKRAFVSTLFSDSPYGNLITLEELKEITPEDLIHFHRERYLSGFRKMAVVGSLSAEQLNEIKKLGNQFTVINTPEVPQSYSYTPQRIDIEKEGAVQSAIRIGRILFNKTHPDFKKFSVVNTILGGYFGSRLMTSIREEKGYTYGIGSGVVQFLKTGYFYISSEVAKEYKEATLEAIKEEILKLQTEEVSQEELSTVQNYMIGSLLTKSDGAFSMMDRFESVHTFGLDLSYYDALIKEIHSISPKEIQELAKKYLKWEDLLIVTAG